jgi:hypothetical protein
VGIVTSIIGACLFQLKYEVMRLENQHKNICHNIRTSEESILILKAEWAHLTNPQRLQLLSQKHLGIQPLAQGQVISFRQHNRTPLPQAEMGGFKVPAQLIFHNGPPVVEKQAVSPRPKKTDSFQQKRRKISKAEDQAIDTLLSDLVEDTPLRKQKGKNP